MSYPYSSDVDRAYNDLRAEGKIFPRPEGSPQIEQDKGLLTQRACYYTSQVNPLMGVMEKSEGNHYVAADGQKFSVDWALRRIDGVGWDIVTDRDAGNGMREAAPVNGEEHPPNPDNIPRWRQATAQNAQVSSTPTPEPEPEPDDDALEQILAAISTSEANIKAHMTSETDRVMQRLADYRQEVIDFANIAGKVLVVMGILRNRE